MSKTAFILAAGLGTRLGTLTHDRPKALVELNGKPLVSHVLDNLSEQGFDRFIINTHHFSELLISYIKEHYSHLNIGISDESNRLMDTGGAIVQALPYLGEDIVLIHNVDIISDLDLNKLYSEFERSNDDAWLLTQERDSTRKLLFNNDLLVGWRNCSTDAFKWVGNPANEYIELSFSGMHLIRPQIFRSFRCEPCSVIDMYLQLAKNRTIRSRQIGCSYWFDLGKPEQLLKAEKRIYHAK